MVSGLSSSTYDEGQVPTSLAVSAATRKLETLKRRYSFRRADISGPRSASTVAPHVQSTPLMSTANSVTASVP